MLYELVRQSKLVNNMALAENEPELEEQHLFDEWPQPNAVVRTLDPLDEAVLTDIVLHYQDDDFHEENW